MSNRADESYGQKELTIVDRFGVWLSGRAIQRELPKRNDLEVLDLGCGYRATQLLALAPKIRRGVGVDFQIAPELESLDRFTFHKGTMEEVLPRLAGQSFDAVLLISVLEHLTDPLFVLEVVRGMLKNSGALLINVPTWRGKRVLEFSAFRLGLSPKVEIADHKTYYDKRDLRPLLIQAGFKPGLIKLRYHKFTLNLFAVARREDG